MGSIMSGGGYGQPNPVEDLFQGIWIGLNTNIRLIRGYEEICIINNRRQQYFIDFVHPETQTAIEFDERSHFGKAYDAQRQWVLERRGWTFIRFKDSDVLRNPGACAQFVLQHIQHRLYSLQGGMPTFSPQSSVIKPPHPRRKLIRWGILSIILVLLLICTTLIGLAKRFPFPGGTQTTSNISTRGNVPPSLSNATTPVADQKEGFPSANSPSEVFDIPGLLHVQGYISCSVSSMITSNTLVLVTDRLTYESAEIQQMKTYFNNVPGASLPKTLQWVSGSTSGCRGYLGVTNISQTTIQISQSDLRLTADVQPNSYDYRLIDICSIVTNHSMSNPYNCLPAGGGGDGYYLNFSLGTGRANSVFSGQMSYYNLDMLAPISPAYPTITPGQEVDISLNFATTTPGDFIYSVVPEITLDISNTRSIEELPQLASTLAFTGANQLTCYGLQGNRFVPTSLKQADASMPVKECA